MATFSERLRTALNNKNMKQSVLAYKLGINRSYISNYLAGKYSARPETIAKMAKILDVSEAWLNGFDVPMHDIPQTKNNEVLKEYVVFHRNGKNVKVKFTPEQQKIFDALVSSSTLEDADK